MARNISARQIADHHRGRKICESFDADATDIAATFIDGDLTAICAAIYLESGVPRLATQSVGRLLTHLRTVSRDSPTPGTRLSRIASSARAAVIVTPALCWANAHSLNWSGILSGEYLPLEE
jgi:hypothetical protein